MCDFSLKAVKSRPAKVGDKLVVHNFGYGTSGFRDVESPIGHDAVAVCVMPGTEIAFDKPVQRKMVYCAASIKPEPHSVAIFRQINKETESTHHDSLELPDGITILLTALEEGQTATVLQLPAAPKSESEAKEQTRLEVVG